MSGKMIVGLDIGTSKVVAIVGEVAADGTLKIVGLGSHASRGLKKGVVVNIESTVQSIQRAVEEAELMAGCQIHSVYAGIAGSHIRSLNSHGIVAIRDREVYAHDVERVIDAAQAVAIPADQKILHILPQEYVIDSQEGIKEPLGMSGVRLEAKVHVVTCAVNASQNIEKCIRRCGLEVEEIILEQLASSYAVLTEDERELGVCLVDIGGGTTDIAIFTEGAIRHTGVIPIAGDQVTNDIAMALAEVVEPRYDELFTLVQAEIRRSGFEDVLAGGIVLTGGTAKMEGVVELAEEIFHMPVRIGAPAGVQGMLDIVKNPIYSTAVGLLLFGVKQYTANAGVKESPGRGLVKKMKQWFQGNF